MLLCACWSNGQKVCSAVKETEVMVHKDLLCGGLMLSFQIMKMDAQNSSLCGGILIDTEGNVLL